MAHNNTSSRPAKPSELVVRDNICICGRMNAGKSTLMNLITGQETSIVDSTPGTTADVKAAVMEIHDFGPVKIFDTAGLDETDILGSKKREKTLVALKESDLVILVVEPLSAARDGNMETERRILKRAEEYGKQAFVFLNIHSGNGSGNEMAIEKAAAGITGSRTYPILCADLTDPLSKEEVLAFIKKHYNRSGKTVDLLPFLGADGFVALNIPMDEETPSGRLLRPQHVVLDYVLRHYIPFAGYRMNLADGRSPGALIRDAERQRYLQFIDTLRRGPVGLQLVITDTQAVDLVIPWTPEDIPVTTFSIVMAHHQSGGNLKALFEGSRELDSLGPGDRVLIAELCNHDRKAEDIGTRQIPRLLNRRYGDHVQIDFAEGRVFPTEEELKRYRLVIQCGGCMVDQQKYTSRIADARRSGIPVTNYGFALSRLHNPAFLERVLRPWGLNV
ncbi:MAG: GTPase [Candidatus Latescibacterota bacterium]